MDPSLDGDRSAVNYKRHLKIIALWALPLTFLGLFYFYPFASILQYSFSRLPDGTVYPFLEALTQPYNLGVLEFTFAQAALSTLLTLLFGLPGAYLFARFDFRGKTLIQALSSIPFVMPTLVVATAFNALLGPRGLVNLGLMSILDLEMAPIQFGNSLLAILTAHVFYNTTIVLRLVGETWSHLDPHLGQAAQMLGASRWHVLRRITLPLLLPAIATAVLLVFLFDFTSFGVILILGGPKYATLEVEIYYQTISLFNLPLAAALSLIQLACTLGMTLVYTHLAERVTRPLSLQPRRYTQQRLTTWRRRWFAWVILAPLLGLLTVPLIALSVRSVLQLEANRGQRQLVDPGFTLDFYKELGVNRKQSVFYTAPSTAIGLSIGYAMTTVVFSLALGLPAAWALAREAGHRINRLLNPIVMLPLGTSAVTLGLGFTLAFSRPPLNLQASAWFIPLAHTLVALPFVVRSLYPALRSIRPRLHQAAAILGASPSQVVRYIDLPLAGRAMLVAAIFAFAISLGEFGATAMITRPEFPTIPVAIYRFLSQPGGMNYGQALALSTILMAVCASGMLIIEQLRVGEVGEF